MSTNQSIDQSNDQSTNQPTMESHQSNLVMVEPPKGDRYRRIKKLSFLLLKIEKKGKEERLVLYDNTAFAFFVWLVFFVEMLKYVYFALWPVSYQHRVFLGELIISKKVGVQRLFSVLMLFVNAAACFPFFVPYFFAEDYRKSFHRLSDFLVVFSLDEFIERFSVSREFARRFVKQLDYLVWLTYILIWSYSVVTYSLFSTNVYMSLKFGYSNSQILACTIPSILNAGLSLIFVYNLIFQSFSFYVLHAQLLKGKVNWLVKNLKGLSAKTNRQVVDEHLTRLNLAIKEFETSRRYFNTCLALFFFTFLSTFALFPAMVIVSGRVLNQLTGFFVGNVNIIVFLVKLNENLGREVGLLVKTFDSKGF